MAFSNQLPRSQRRRVTRILGLGAIGLILAACTGTAGSPSPDATAIGPSALPSAGSGASASTPEGRLDELCQRASAEEGKVVYWHSPSNSIAALIPLFNERYPGIEVEPLEARPEDHVPRLIAEVTAGQQVTPDVLHGILVNFAPLAERDLIDTSTDWAALGVRPDLIHDTLNTVRSYRSLNGLAYNPEKLKPEDLPNTWEELIDPRWVGQLIVDPNGRPFAELSLKWGVDKTLDYVQRLKDTVKPLVIAGGTAGMLAVAGGEASLTASGRSDSLLEQQAEGAPLAIKYLDTIVTIDGYNAALKGARHPLAAQCWMAWFSTVGQELYNTYEFKTNDPEGLPADADLVLQSTAADADQVFAISEQIGKIFTQ